MNSLHNNESFVFIVGSPRSGTTILGEILDHHRDISQWYEPYFMWDRYFRNHPDDIRMAENATPKIKKYIQNNFLTYQKKTGSKIIIDKSPRNSLKIDFIKTIFPDSKFIHIIRDGRDATLSINKEWNRRRKIVADSQNQFRFNYLQAFKVIQTWLLRQPFVYDRIRAFWFETHGNIFSKYKHLNRLRWRNEVGWGPKFKGWHDIYNNNSLLQFNAYQWSHCLENINKSWQGIPQQNKIEIRYENFVNKGEEIIRNVIDWLHLTTSNDFLKSLPVLKNNNFNKWKTEFNENEKEQIKPILSPLLNELGYLQRSPWEKK